MWQIVVGRPVSFIVEMEKVNSTGDSQHFFFKVSGRLFERESTATLDVSGRLFGRGSAAALVSSGQLFRRELTAALKWSALWQRGVTTIGSSEERLDRALD